MLKLALLGEPTATLDATPITDFRSAKVQALFYYLVATRQVHTRHHLAGLLWGEAAEEQAKNSLRVSLNNLNKLFPDYIESTRLTVAFKTDRPHWLDIDEFSRQTATLNTSTPDLIALQAAAKLYQNDFLAGLEAENAPDFADWLQAERTRWRQAVVNLLAVISNNLVEERRYADAVDPLRRLLALAPWREEAHRTLMVALARQGQLTAASAQYELCRQGLAETLGVKPMPETYALFQRIRDAQGRQPHNLPAESSPLIGRSLELQQLANLLENPACRLITIVGLGGIGKTRLALAAASASQSGPTLPFLNGVAFAPLLNVATPDLLPVALADAIGLRLSGSASPITQVLNALRNQETLLVLDNFEHLLPPPQVNEEGKAVALLRQILEAAPDVKLLVTSREPLQLALEWRFDLEGLAASEGQEVRDKETGRQGDEEQETREQRADEPSKISPSPAAIALLVQTAQESDPAFQLTATDAPFASQLCRIVGGSPLAIKLAALLLRTLALPELVAKVQENLDLLATEHADWSPRQRSMRAIFDYTYGLLGREEQALFGRLTLFHDSFTEAAAQTVAGASPWTLAALTDHGLVQVTATPSDLRYTIHELVRQYGAEKRNAGEVAAVRSAHARFYAQLVQQHEQFLYGARYQQAIAAVESELPNIRAAWGWLLTQLADSDGAAPAIALLRQLAPTLAFFHEVKALFQAGDQLFGDAIAALQTAGIADNAFLAQLQRHQAAFAFEVSDFARAMALAATAAPVLLSAGAATEAALAQIVQGRAHLRRGDYDQAQQLLESGLAICQRLHHLRGQAEAQISLGMVASAIGEYARAQHALQAARTLCEQLGFAPWLARVLTNLGTIYARQYDYTNALPFYQQSLTIAEAEGTPTAIMINTSNLGGVYRGFGQGQLSITYYQRSLSMARSMGDRRWIAANLNGLGMTYLELGDMAAASRTLQEAIAEGQAIESHPDTLGGIALYAQVLARRGMVNEALQALLFAAGHPATMAQYTLYNARLLQELQEELPDAAIVAARSWGAGRSVAEVGAWLQNLL